MMDAVFVMGATILSIFLAWGALDMYSKGEKLVWSWHSMTALAAICGGGVYAVALVDSSAIAHFSWLYITIIIVVTWCWLWLIRSDRAYLHLVNAIISSDTGGKEEEYEYEPISE